jgi:hypothetical protein
MDNEYKGLTYESDGKQYVSSGSTSNFIFATSPWEGEITFNNIGNVVQYRNGVWELMQ